jgi:hypothetical protein
LDSSRKLVEIEAIWLGVGEDVFAGGLARAAEYLLDAEGRLQKR